MVMGELMGMTSPFQRISGEEWDIHMPASTRFISKLITMDYIGMYLGYKYYCILKYYIGARSKTVMYVSTRYCYVRVLFSFVRFIERYQDLGL